MENAPNAASGGNLPPVAFNRLLDALGFPAEAHVPEDRDG